MNQKPFQDEIPYNFCFGCGPTNQDGLQIKSVWEGEESVCLFHPSPVHSAGPRQFLNGGIIATLMDCHCLCTAIANIYREENREIGSEPLIWCVTASIKVTYLHPTPIGGPVLLRARVTEREGKKTALFCSLFSGELECAQGEVLAVQVPPSWMD